MTPISSDGRTHLRLDYHTAVVDGAAAGNVTVTGIRPNDQLLAVTRFEVDTGSVVDVHDITEEFSISDDDTINNDDGTATTGDRLRVEWLAAHEHGGDLNRE